MEELLALIEPLYADADRFKQRAAAEVIAGLLRGSKHWREHAREKVWSWFVQRMDSIFAQIKPDTLSFWEIAFHVCDDILCVKYLTKKCNWQYPLRDHDPRRSRPLVDWLLSLRLDFQSDSAFARESLIQDIAGIALTALQ